MKVTFFSREFPPHVYGGAGVHLKNLAGELSRSIDVEVRCIGDQDVRSFLGQSHRNRLAQSLCATSDNCDLI